MGARRRAREADERVDSGADGLGWAQGPNGHTLVILPAPLEFRMGSPENEEGRFEYETLHFRRIDRSLAVTTKEVTIEQFREFKPKHAQDLRHSDPNEQGHPANSITWYDAVGYCNWLSRKAGIVDPKQWCYAEKIERGMVLAADAVKRPGFRLPTEAEWEYFCRAQTETSRPFGEFEQLLPRYAWTWLNSGDHTMQVGRLLPNELGLFDTLGNMWEWCHDGPVRPTAYEHPPYPAGTMDRPATDPGRRELVEEDTWRILRGGAFDYSPSCARSSYRYAASVDLRHAYLGFRVVRTLSQKN